MLRSGHVVFLCALALLCVGVIMVNSAGMSIRPVEVMPLGADAAHTDSALTPDRRHHDSVGHFFASILISRSTAYMVLAVAAMCAAAALPLHRLPLPGSGAPGAPDARRAQRIGLIILAAGVVVLLIVLSSAYWPGIGREVNGSRRWIHLPVPGLRVFSFQPSELAKWGLIALLAAYCAARAALMPSFLRGLLPALAALALIGGAVAHEDLGTGILIVAAGSMVLIAGGARLWHFLMFIPPALAGIVILCITNPYRLRRIETFFDPYLQPQGTGYHMIQSMTAVAGGEGFGRGLGHGLQKFGYLPEDTTDFLFAIICEELGIAGAAAVICLYILLLWAGLAIIRGQHSTLFKLAGLGIIATVGLQALINLAVVTGLAPTKGIALPLVSAGGTGWILTAASLGLLVAMDRTCPQSRRHRATPADADDLCTPAPPLHWLHPRTASTITAYPKSAAST